LQAALLELVAPEGLAMSHRDPEVGSINRQQTIPPDISLLPVFEYDLWLKMKDELQFDKEENEHNNHLLLTKTSVNPKSDWMYGQTYLFIVLGSFPPNIVDRAMSFVGYIHMNASAHR
jgi:hypothetical protein